MSKPKKKTDTTPNTATTPAAALAHLDAAIAAEREAAAARDAAHKAKEAARTSRGTPIEADHAALVAARAALVAEDAIHGARLAALGAGAGAPEEAAHPGAFGVVELAEEIGPMVDRKLDLLAEIARLDAATVDAVARMQARRAEVAADPARPSSLGEPGPVPVNLPAVLAELATQHRAGRRDERAIAAAAGWRQTLGGAGEVPPELRGDALVAAALAGVKPRAPRHKGRIEQIDRDVARLENLAAELAERRAEEERERAKFAREHEARKAADAERERRQAEERRREYEAEARAAEKKREAGRQAIAAGGLPTSSAPPKLGPANPLPNTRIL